MQAGSDRAVPPKSDRVVSAEPAEPAPLAVDPAPAVDSAVPQAGAASASLAASRSVVVHIDSPTQVVLERSSGRRSWEVVCASPCDRAVPTAASYRISSPGVRTSDTFSLEQASGERVTIEVDPASATVHGVGVAAVIVGFSPVLVAATVAVGGALVIGVIVLIGCPIADALGDDFGGCAEELFGGAASGYWEVVSDPVALGIMGGGIVLGVTGIVLLSTSKGTGVQLLGTPAAARLPSGYGMLPHARGPVVPILSGTF